MGTQDKWMWAGAIMLLGYGYYHFKRAPMAIGREQGRDDQTLRARLDKVLGAKVPYDMKNFADMHESADDPIARDILLGERLKILEAPLGSPASVYPGWRLCGVLANFSIPWHLPDDTLAVGFIRVFARTVSDSSACEGTGVKQPRTGLRWEKRFEPVFIPNPNMVTWLDPEAMVPAGISSRYTVPDPSTATRCEGSGSTIEPWEVCGQAGQRMNTYDLRLGDPFDLSTVTVEGLDEGSVRELWCNRSMVSPEERLRRGGCPLLGTQN